MSPSSRDFGTEPSLHHDAPWEPRPRVIGSGPGTISRLHLVSCRFAMALLLKAVRGRGLHRAVTFLSRFFGRRNFVIVEVFGRRQFKVLLSDRYWIPAILGRGTYEPEIGYVIGPLLRNGIAFLDCGANLGWWSVFASTRIERPDHILAIEASSVPFAGLKENAALNQNGFRCMRAAIWSESGETVKILSDRVRHGRSRVMSKREEIGRNSFIEDVASISLTKVVRDHFPGDVRRLIIKLDIEGSEQKALEGMDEELMNIALIVYEDHGKEARSEVTTDLLEKRFHVFYCDELGQTIEIENRMQLAKVKRDVRRGYNFFACATDSDWCESLRVLIGTRN